MFLLFWHHQILARKWVKRISYILFVIGKDFDAGRDWGQEEKGTTEDEMAGWQHWLDGRESEWTLGVGDGQGGLACCDSWGGKESDTTERLNWTELMIKVGNVTVFHVGVCVHVCASGVRVLSSAFTEWSERPSLVSSHVTHIKWQWARFFPLLYSTGTALLQVVSHLFWT